MAHVRSVKGAAQGLGQDLRGQRRAGRHRAQPQEKAGLCDVDQRIALHGIAPVDDDGAAPSVHDLVRVKVAVAQAIAVGQPGQERQHPLFFARRESIHAPDPLLDRLPGGGQARHGALVHGEMQPGKGTGRSPHLPGPGHEGVQHGRAVDALKEDPRAAVDLGQSQHPGRMHAAAVRRLCDACLPFRCLCPGTAKQLEHLIVAPGIDLGGAPLPQECTQAGVSGSGVIVRGWGHGSSLPGSGTTQAGEQQQTRCDYMQCARGCQSHSAAARHHAPHSQQRHPHAAGGASLCRWQHIPRNLLPAQLGQQLLSRGP
jgi:hypothetical protein